MATQHASKRYISFSLHQTCSATRLVNVPKYTPPAPSPEQKYLSETNQIISGELVTPTLFNHHSGRRDSASEDEVGVRSLFLTDAQLARTSAPVGVSSRGAIDALIRTPPQCRPLSPSTTSPAQRRTPRLPTVSRRARHWHSECGPVPTSPKPHAERGLAWSRTGWVHRVVGEDDDAVTARCTCVATTPRGRASPPSHGECKEEPRYGARRSRYTPTVCGPEPTRTARGAGGCTREEGTPALTHSRWGRGLLRLHDEDAHDDDRGSNSRSRSNSEDAPMRGRARWHTARGAQGDDARDFGASRCKSVSQCKPQVVAGQQVRKRFHALSLYDVGKLEDGQRSLSLHTLCGTPNVSAKCTPHLCRDALQASYALALSRSYSRSPRYPVARKDALSRDRSSVVCVASSEPQSCKTGEVMNALNTFT